MQSMFSRELDLHLDYVGREENASPAVGSMRVSNNEQEAILTEAIGPPTSVGDQTAEKPKAATPPRRRGRGKEASRKKKKKAS